jgi:hypothetical protein
MILGLNDNEHWAFISFLQVRTNRIWNITITLSPLEEESDSVSAFVSLTNNSDIKEVNLPGIKPGSSNTFETGTKVRQGERQKDSQRVRGVST